MNNNRKEIIISEIHYWKQSKLLPSQYCDFLLALYTEGDTTNSQEPHIKSKGRSVSAYMFLLNALVLLGSLSLYITELSIFLQTPIYAILITISGVSLWFCMKRAVFIQFPLLVMSLSIFLFTVDSITFLAPNQFLGLSLGVMANCLLWLYLGRKFKLHYFTLSSVLGIILLGYVYLK